MISRTCSDPSARSRSGTCNKLKENEPIDWLHLCKRDLPEYKNMFEFLFLGLMIGTKMVKVVK